MADPIPSRAARVVVYEDRALVTRTAALQLGAGVRWYSVGGVGLAADDRTVRAGVVSGSGTVVGARLVRHVPRDDGARAGVIDLRREAEAADRRAEQAALAVQRADDAAARVDELAQRWVTAAARVSQAPRDAPDGDGVAAAWAEALDLLRAESEAAARARVAAGRLLGEAQEARERARIRLRQAETAAPPIAAEVQLQINAPAEGAATVEFEYLTPGAAWRPEHLARLSGGADPAVELVTWGVVWQATGEAWDEVDLRLSTARPSAAAAAPLLSDDVLLLRRKSDEERRTIVAEAREEAIAVAGVAGARRVEALPGVDDGGRPVVLEGRLASIPSDGRPHRVAVAHHTVPVAVDLILAGERSAVAHVRARGTWDGADPLLAGPVRLARAHSFVGLAPLEFVAPGEPFELGFGVDDAVRVRRRVDERRDTTALAGAQVIQRQVHLYLSNLSDRPKELVVTERVPVSELEQIQVRPEPSGAFGPPDRDGFAEAALVLAPRGTAHLELAYELRAPANVRLPF